MSDITNLPADAAPTADAQIETPVPEGTEGDVPTAGDIGEAKIEKQAADAKKKYKVKLENEEAEVDEDELVRGYQKAKASAKRFEEAARMKKQAEQLFQGLKSNTIESLKQAGFSDQQIREMAENYLIEKYKAEEEEATLDPKDKELREAKDRLKKYEEQEKLKAQQEEQDQFVKMKQKYEAEIDAQIVDALEKNNLPKTAYTVKRMAQYLARAVDMDLEVSPQDVVEMVRDDYKTDLDSFLNHYDGEKLLEVLPRSVIEKVNKAQVAKAKAKQAPAPTSTKTVATPQTTKEPVQRKKMSVSEWRESLMKDSK